MPHFGHAIVSAIVEIIAVVPTDVVAISSRSGIGWRDAYGRVVCVHSNGDIDPGDPANMSLLLAFEWTQASPQSFCLNDLAS